MLSRLKKKVKKKSEINFNQLMLLVLAGIIVLAVVKFKGSNPFVSHK